MLCYTAGYAQEPPGYKLYVQPYAGFKHDDLRWSIAGDANGENPNVLSELIWKKIRGPQAGISLDWNVWRRFYLFAGISYSWTTSGRVTDTDYTEDNRQGSDYHENLRADKGNMFTLDAKLRYALYEKGNLRIMPEIGYTRYVQHFYMLDNEAPLVENEKLNSTYDPVWQGVSVGGELFLELRPVQLNLGVSGSFLDYRAKANWNLIDDFAHPVSFRHRASGMGWKGWLGAGYPVHKNLQVFVNVSGTYRKTGTGTDELFYARGNQVTTQLNESIGKSFYIGAGIRLYFYDY